MPSYPAPNPNIPQTIPPSADLNTLTHAVRVLKEAVDSLAGHRGQPTHRAVTFDDLASLGLVLPITTVSTGGRVNYASQDTVDLDFGSLAAIASSGSATDLITGTVPSARVSGNYGSITGVGTLTSGTWNGTVVAGEYGGTGVNNAGFTITLGGDLVMSGAFDTTFTVTGATSVTLPSGTHTLMATDYSNAVAMETFHDEPAAPTGTSSVTFVMMGLAGSYTPAATGKVLLIISGDARNTVAGNGAGLQIRGGTGAAPANGDAPAGSTFGAAIRLTAVPNNSDRFPFSIQAVIEGLSISTTYWFDLALSAVTGGTAVVAGLTMTAVEVG